MSSGSLVCSGVIVIVDDETQALVTKMSAGVPYQASIEHGLDDCVMEFVPEGMTSTVNGQTVSGPMTIVRQWTLDAVAICKFGADDETSATLQMAKKTTEPQKGFFIRFSKQQVMSMDTNKIEPVICD